MVDITYLDNNATTRLAPEVFSEMRPYLEEHYGNPSSIYHFGSQVGKKIEEARERVQMLLGAEYATEVIFTASATEATATAIHSALEAYPERREIVTSVIEHPATLALCQHLERQGYRVHWIGVDSKGSLDLTTLKSVLTERVAVVSLMWANNETGTLFPIETVGSWVKEVGAQFHVDAVQVVGKYPINIAQTSIDMLSLSAHKFHGPKGVGALYVKRGNRFRPLLRGGHQERGRRAGTENTAGIIGLGKAAELAISSLADDLSRIKVLRDHLEQTLLAVVPHSFVTGDPQCRVANTCNIAFEFIEGEALLLMLDQLGIAASSGSACTSGALEPSHVMKAMGVPLTAAHGTLRFSLSRYTTEEEINRVIDALPKIVAQLRNLSPYWNAETNSADMSSFVPQYG